MSSVIKKTFSLVNVSSHLFIHSNFSFFFKLEKIWNTFFLALGEEVETFNPQHLYDKIWKGGVSESFKPPSLTKFDEISDLWEHIASINTCFRLELLEVNEVILQSLVVVMQIVHTSTLLCYGFKVTTKAIVS